MENLSAEVFKKSGKKNNNLLIIGLVLLIITVLLIYYGIQNENKELPTPDNLRELVANKKNEENVYAYLDVAIKPYLFAVYETNGVEDESKYYFVMDQENNLYILYMKEFNYKKLNVEGIEENPIRIHGITKKIPNDIKKLAIESYNEIISSEYLTNDNFNDEVGTVYLDTESNVNDSSLYYIGAFLTGVFFISIIIVYIVTVIKNKTTFKNISKEELAKIDSEISQMSNSEYANMNFYLLKDYVVDLTNNVVLLKYSDLVWAYPYEQRYNGLLINKCIKLIDKNNKIYNIANTKVLEKNKDEVLQEILKKIEEKNSNLILGFTNDNRKLAKEKIKELKNKN